MEPLPLTPMVRWSVEVKLIGTPVMVLPLVSITVAVVGCGVFGVTVTLVPPLAESVIDFGGQVEKYPAVESYRPLDQQPLAPQPAAEKKNGWRFLGRRKAKTPRACAWLSARAHPANPVKNAGT